jgi:hypothetical protein
MQSSLVRSEWGTFRPAGKDATGVATKKRVSNSGSDNKSKGGAGKPAGSGGGGGGGGDDDGISVPISYIVIAYMLYNFLSSMYWEATGKVEKIDFQAFRNDVLARDVVDKVWPAFFFSL